MRCYGEEISIEFHLTFRTASKPFRAARAVTGMALQKREEENKNVMV
jgi:hypothetical protein